MDVSRYIDGWRTRARQDERSILDAVQRARQAIPAVVAILRRYGAGRIWLIGSLPRGTFRPSSDLDFLVEGLSEAQAWRASSEAAEASHFPVDVLRAEGLPSYWLEYHQKYGERLDG